MTFQDFLKYAIGYLIFLISILLSIFVIGQIGATFGADPFTTDPLGVFINACVGLALFFVGWQTYKVTTYQANTWKREQIRHNYYMLKSACNKAFPHKEKFIKETAAANTGSAFDTLLKMSDTAQHIYHVDDIILQEFWNVVHDAELVGIKEITDYVTLVLRAVIDQYEIDRDPSKKFDSDKFRAFYRFMIGSHSEVYKKYLK